MKKYILYLIFFLSLAIFSCSESNLDKKINKVDELIDNFVKRNNIPGLSVTIINKEGKIKYSEGFGYSDLENNKKIIPSNSIFRIGSFSKTLTGTLLMKLYQNKQIEIDSSVGHYINNLPIDKNHITLRQIAGHKSGIRHYKDGDGMKINQNYKSNAEAIKFFINDSLLYEPGTKFSYSTHAWTLLSLAIEKAYGNSFTNIVKDEIFSPLGLENTYPEKNDLFLADKVSFYEKNDLGINVVCHEVNNSWKWAGGGYVSTTEEMASFTWQILNSDFLRPESVNEMIKSQSLPNKEKTNYGIGWATIYDEKGNKYFGHTGGSVGGTTFVFSSKNGNIISIMANISDASFGKLPFKLFEIFNN